MGNSFLRCIAILLWHVCRHHAVVAWWFVIPMILIFWFCIWSGIWFYFYIKHHHIFLSYLLQSILFLSMHDVLLTPLSWRLEGYPFSPLIPLFFMEGMFGITCIYSFKYSVRSFSYLLLIYLHNSNGFCFCLSFLFSYL